MSTSKQAMELVLKAERLLTNATPAEDMPDAYDHDRYYSQQEQITLEADKELRKLIPLLVSVLKEAIKQQGEPVAWNVISDGRVHKLFRLEKDADEYVAILAKGDIAKNPIAQPLCACTSAPTIPADMVLVPIVPTEAMLDAFRYEIGPASNWRYMLSAAPKYKGD